MADYEDGPKLDFAMFENKYKTTDRHPAELGEIELNREFLRAVVDRAKEGQFPVVLRVARWNNTTKDGKSTYGNHRLELKRLSKGAKGPPVEEEQASEDNTDGLPF